MARKAKKEEAPGPVFRSSADFLNVAAITAHAISTIRISLPPEAFNEQNTLDKVAYELSNRYANVKDQGFSAIRFLIMSGVPANKIPWRPGAKEEIAQIQRQTDLSREDAERVLLRRADKRRGK